VNKIFFLQSMFFFPPIWVEITEGISNPLHDFHQKSLKWYQIPYMISTQNNLGGLEKKKTLIEITYLISLKLSILPTFPTETNFFPHTIRRKITVIYFRHYKRKFPLYRRLYKNGNFLFAQNFPQNLKYKHQKYTDIKLQT